MTNSPSSKSIRQYDDSLWLINRQEFIYHTKHGARKNFTGNTVLKYRDIEPNYVFPEKFFWQ